MSVMEEIAAERRRQIEIEGWTDIHDDEHNDGALALAAGCYCLDEPRQYGIVPAAWPWSAKWWKPKDKRRNLVRAAALIVAEIERLDRTTKAA
jgi:hypothetical protein